MLLLFIVVAQFLHCYCTAASNVMNVEACDEGPCSAGEWYNVSINKCVDCMEGTFVSQEQHRCTDCKPCMRAAPELEEIVLENCTRISDTVVGCMPGYFRTLNFVDNWPEPVCEKCSVCEHGQVMVKECELDNDTVCVPKQAPDDDGATQDDHSDGSGGWSLTIGISVFGGVSIVIAMAFIMFCSRRGKEYIPCYGGIYGSCARRSGKGDSFLALASGADTSLVIPEAGETKM